MTVDGAATGRHAVAWPTDGLSFGGDYNPEQWPSDVWREDIELMGIAGVNLVTLGVFSWGMLEPRDNEYDWGWFDDIIGLLADGGIAVDLATPTAAPPNWLLHQHPEILPVDEHLVPYQPGGRLGWCPSSPVFRTHALRITQALAERYGSHPAVRLWHVSNELGGGNARCYCAVSASRFREWLRDRYESIDALNAAWNTAFWGHRFGLFAEIEPPRGNRDVANPSLFLDYARFSSDELLAHYDAEAVILRAHSAAPVTTNFMVNSGAHVVNYSAWAGHVDIVANDHYTLVSDPGRAQELSFSADRMRGLTRGRRPWMLMEHSTGAPAWQQRNRAKEPGEIARNALAHVARGSDSAMFFQWRASLGGAEQYHSAMLPHDGTDTRVWREVVALGDALRRLACVAGSPVEPAKVALLVDEESAWAFEQGLKPHRALKYSREPRLWHSAFWNRQVLIDVLPADAPLDDYTLVIVPSLYIVGQERADRIAQYVATGGTALITYLSGIVDQTNKVLPGGYPGAFRAILGAWSEEFRPLQLRESIELDDGSTVVDWTEDTVVEHAERIIDYVNGAGAGRAAVTRHEVGSGSAWYVSTALDVESSQRIVDRLITELALPRTSEAPPGVEAVRRCTDTGDVLFLINHTSEDAEVRVAGVDLLTGNKTGPSTLVPAGRVVTLQEAAHA